jgi:hypothetical protein
VAGGDRDDDISDVAETLLSVVPALDTLERLATHFDGRVRT